MAAIVAALVTLIGTFVTFVQDYLIPATAADINLIHVAIWTPVVLGLLSLTGGFLKGMWARRGRKA